MESKVNAQISLEARPWETQVGPDLPLPLQQVRVLSSPETIKSVSKIIKSQQRGAASPIIEQGAWPSESHRNRSTTLLPRQVVVRQVSASISKVHVKL